MVSCWAPGCRNLADKKFNIITLVTVLFSLHCEIFGNLAHLIPEAYSKPCQISNMMRYIENPDMVRKVCSGIFRHIQEHSAIFSHVQVHWGTLRNIEAYSGIVEVFWAIFITLWNPYLYNRAIFRTLGHLEREAASEACGTSKMIWHIQSFGIVRTFYSNIFEDILKYSGILMHIQSHSQVRN